MNHRGYFQVNPIRKHSLELIPKNGSKVHKVHTLESENPIFVSFCHSVQYFAFIERGIHIKDEAIQAELDEIDIKCLSECGNDETQAWAEMLAYRLCREHMGEAEPRLSTKPAAGPKEAEGVVTTGAVR